MKKLLISLGLLSGLYVIGCGGTTSLTCATPAGTGHVCIAASGSGGSSGGTATCPAGTSSVSSCTSTGAAGTCTITETAGGASATAATTYYTDGGFTTATVKQACMASGGTFTSG